MVVNKYLAEFFGTFILVFLGSMGILAVGGANGPAEIVAQPRAYGLRQPQAFTRHSASSGPPLVRGRKAFCTGGRRLRVNPRVVRRCGE